MRSREALLFGDRWPTSMCVSGSWYLGQRYERSVVVAGIIGHTGVLLDHDPFRTSGATAYFRIHVVLAIATWRKAVLAILKLTPSDIARYRLALPGLDLC